MRRRWLVLPLALLALVAGLAVLRWWDWRFEHSQDARILAAARRYRVDPALIKAVVWRESRFNPRALGRAGEVGLMQLLDAAAQEWAEAERCYPVPDQNLFDPGTNILAGTYYLGKMLQRYRRTDDPRPYALADYNAGRANVLKWGRGAAATNSAAFLAAIGFPGTQDYVRSILERRARYRDDFPPLDTLHELAR